MNINSVSLDTLKRTKGIGAKTIERILEQHKKEAVKQDYITKVAQLETPQELTIKPNSIIQGDALKVMRTNIPDNTVDMILTSPPYDDLRIYDGYVFDYKSMIKELYRVLKEGGVMAWIVGDETVNGSETGTGFKQALHAIDVGFNLHDTMIYMKDSPSYPSNKDSVRHSQIFEYMFIFSKGKPKTVNLICDRKNKWGGHTSYGKASTRGKDGKLKQGRQINVSEYGVRFNVWEVNTGYGKSTKDEIAYEHPAIFPESLAEDHIKTWSSKGDLILDPMCGSGTTCKMAMLNNRDYIGIDVSEEYVKIANNRINLHKTVDK